MHTKTDKEHRAAQNWQEIIQDRKILPKGCIGGIFRLLEQLYFM